MEKTSYLVAALAVGLFVCQQLVAAQTEFYDYQIENEGMNITLHCNQTFNGLIIPNGSIPISWMLPDLTVLYHGTEKYVISSDNWTMTVVDARASEFGLYHCMLWTENSQWFLVRLGLNAEGPYFEDLWAKYDTNTYTAIGAAGGFLAIVGLLVVVYTFHYVPPETKDQDQERDEATSESSSEVRRRHVNGGNVKEMAENGVAVIGPFNNCWFKLDEPVSGRGDNGPKDSKSGRHRGESSEDCSNTRETTF